MRNVVKSILALVLPSCLLYAQITFTSQGTQLTPQLTPPAGNTPPDQKCVLQGRVINSQTGEPLKKTGIRLARHGSGTIVMVSGPGSGIPMGGQGYSTVSDADGSFRIEGIEPGDYILWGQRSGYLNTQYGAKRPMALGTILTLRPAQQMTDISLALLPQAVISGKVVDEDGDPINGAMVQVLRQTWERGKLAYLPRSGSPTNDLGEFRAADLGPGKYYVCAQKMNFQMPGEEQPTAPGKPDIRPIRTCYPGATTIETATPIEITAGQDAADTNIRMQSAQSYHVRGKVVGNLPAGESQRMSVSISARDEQAFFFGNQTIVGKDQSFDIAGVAPGSYNITVMVMGGGIRNGARQPVDVGQGDVNDLIVTLFPPGSLRGQIRLEGTPQAGSPAGNLANVHVSLSPADQGMIFGRTPNAQAKPDGSFTLESVAAGKYYVQVHPPAGAYLKSVHLGQEEIAGKTLDLTQGVAGELDIVFRYGVAEVDGTLQGAQNTSAADASSTGQAATSGLTASVVLVPDVLDANGSGMQFGSTNQNGTFTIKQVPPGHYRAYAFEQIDQNQLQNPELLKQLEAMGAEVEVNENDRKQLQLSLISADDVQQLLTRLGIDSSQ